MTTKKKVFRIVAVVLAVAIICCLASAGIAQEPDLDHFTYLPMVMTGGHLPRPTPTAPRPTATPPPLPTYTPEAP